MKSVVKKQMTLENLNSTKPELIGLFLKTGAFIDVNTQKYPSVDLKRQGFYFFVSKSTSNVVARFYIGRRRSQCGFENGVRRHILAEKTSVGKSIMNANTDFYVFYVPSENMKTLTTAFGKNKIGQMLTRPHNDRYQNLEEINRMLNDNFVFTFQKF